MTPKANAYPLVAIVLANVASGLATVDAFVVPSHGARAAGLVVGPVVVPSHPSFPSSYASSFTVLRDAPEVNASTAKDGKSDLAIESYLRENYTLFESLLL